MSARLLLDQNLPFRLLETLSGPFPGSDHVRPLGLDRSSDRDIWEHARLEGFSIMSKDGDFHHLSLLFGHPPKFVWLRMVNCSSDEIIAFVARNRDRISSFCREAESSVLVLDRDD